MGILNAIKKRVYKKPVANQVKQAKAQAMVKNAGNLSDSEHNARIRKMHAASVAKHKKAKNQSIRDKWLVEMQMEKHK